FSIPTDTARQQPARLRRPALHPPRSRSRLAWPRDYSESPAPSNIVALLDRLEYARGLGIDPARGARIHPTRLARLINEGVLAAARICAYSAAVGCERRRFSGLSAPVGL
ncbi:hypothetical protein, partial [Acidiphilium sp.]|uniref:hypothetical protein n=1 Tax=Acidiphilium sp. TaxID=527 RepID=UPI00258CBC57